MKKNLFTLLLLCLFSLGIHAQTSAGLIANYQLNGNPSDASGSGNHGTLTSFPLIPGSTPISTNNRFGDANHAYDFNGLNDYIKITPTNNFTPQLPVTISAWVKIDDHNPNMVFQNSFLENYYLGVWMNIVAGGRVSVGYGDGDMVDDTNRRSKETNNSLSIGKWHHIAAIIRGATDMDIFINGIENCGTYSGSGGPLSYVKDPGPGGSTGPGSGGSATLITGVGVIGRSDNQSAGGSGDQFFNGKIDNVRFYDRALTLTEVRELYSSNENCPEPLLFQSSTTGLVSYYTLQYYMADDHSGNHNHGKIYGTVPETNECNILYSSLSFDGTDDYVLLTNNQNFHPQLPVSISSWVYLEDYQPNMIFKNDFKENVYSGVWMNVTGNGTLTAGFGDGGSVGQSSRRSRVGTTVLDLKKWYHVAAVIRSATDMDLYVNGVRECGSNSGSGGGLAYTQDANGKPSHGVLGKSDNHSSPTTGLQYFHGRMDEVMFYNRELRSGDIFELYEFSDCLAGCNLARKENPSPTLVKELEVHIYPNPNNGVFHLQFSDDAETQLSLRDLSGRIVWREETTVSKYEAFKINVAQLPAGIYLLTSKTQNHLRTHKVVIN
ncbi:MAG: LamG-like jellyroll fold domain-containing protein [Bacteroidota bacterium]